MEVEPPNTREKSDERAGQKQNKATAMAEYMGKKSVFAGDEMSATKGRTERLNTQMSRRKATSSYGQEKDARDDATRRVDREIGDIGVGPSSSSPSRQVRSNPFVNFASCSKPLQLNEKILKNLDSSHKGIIWNFRGAKSAATIREMKRLCKEHQPDFMFISETKSSQNDYQKLARKLKFPNFDGILAVGNAGGILLFWNDITKIHIISKDNSYLHCEFNSEKPREKWVVSFIQAPPYAQEKAKF